jgi:primosomal protein N' (replication factor Y)
LNRFFLLGQEIQPMMYVDVVFNLAIDKSFTYKVPTDILSDIKVGQRVLAPFGKKELTGIVVALSERNPYIKCKDIVDVLDDEPLIQQDIFRLTKWMSEYYLASWGMTLQIALPKGLDKRSKEYIDIIEINSTALVELTEKQRDLFDLIVREPAKTTAYYKNKYGTGSFDYSLRVLEAKYLIKRRKQISRERVRKKMVRFFTVSENFISHLSGLREQDEIKRLLLPLIGKTISLSDFRLKTGLSMVRIKTLLKRRILSASELEVYREPTQDYEESTKKIQLNDDQKFVLSQINETLDRSIFKVFLLHGVTGSGKTQVYLEAIKRVIGQNKSAIVLIPEISLTPQTVARFKNFFQENVYVFHSRMSLGERYDTWRQVKQREKCIVIGPRSALFLPVQNLGLIIVDEEHDSSFKQESPAPRYHARDTAVYRAQLNKSVVVLGSATPSLETYFNVESGKYHLLKLKNRIDNIELPLVKIVRMKVKANETEEANIFSPELIEHIRTSIENKEQVILLQNRRGFSSYLQCKTCGFIKKCPDCDIYLTFHVSSHSLQCHYCGFAAAATNNCPKCNGLQIKYVGAGTQQIETELRYLFPGVKTLRMDIDTTTAKNAHEKILKQFKDQKADILLGTQMIAKGLDFDNVSLVGVISADIGLTLPDFRSAERIFQLLTQVSGRAGRKKKQGKVIIQTRMDKHYAIQYAQTHDFEGFYNHEICLRKESAYPPITRLMKIGVSSTNIKDVNAMAKDIVKRLSRYSNGIFIVIGPAPAPMIRLQNKYRWQVLIKINTQKDRSGKKVRSFIKTALDPLLRDRRIAQSISIDVDPLDMM